MTRGAYVVSLLTVCDPDAFEMYRDRAAQAIATFGGHYVVRGGKMEILEGADQTSGVVVARFEDAANATRWYASDEYARALNFRDAALTRTLILVEGVY